MKKKRGGVNGRMGMAVGSTIITIGQLEGVSALTPRT